MVAFEVLAAVDVRGGRVVRLKQGDFERETVYGEDPLDAANRFEAQGARWLHVVDLDRARDGGNGQSAIVAAMARSIGSRIALEIAGGLRDAASVDAMLAAGARRAVIGTAALRDATFARALVDRFGPERIAIALDVRGGLAVGEGWRTGAPGVPVERALDVLAAVGVTTFEVTAIERDGLLEGPDLALLRGLVERDRGAIIASAGIGSLGDIEAVRGLGCAGAIVGRALYDGRLTLPEILAVIDEPTAVASDGRLERPADRPLAESPDERSGDAQGRG